MPYKPAESYSITKKEAPEMFEIANIIGESAGWSVAQTIEFLALEAGRPLTKEIKKRKANEALPFRG